MIRRQFGLRALFWVVTIVAVFLAARHYLPVESPVRHFWFAVSITMLAVIVLKLALRLGSSLLQPRER